MAYIIVFTKKNNEKGYQLVIRDYLDNNKRAKEFINEQTALNMVQFCNIKMFEPMQLNKEVVYDSTKGFIYKDLEENEG